jgi:hypothetical protein
MPVASIVPTEESPPGIPFTAHVTEVLEVPLTVAVNCSLSRTMAVVLLGETETEMMRTAGGGALPPPPHPTDRTSCSTAAAQRNALWVPPFMTALIVRCSKVAQLVKCLNLTPKGVLPQVMGASIRLAPRFLCSPSPPTEITERCSDRQGLLELHCPLNCALEAEVRSGPTGSDHPIGDEIAADVHGRKVALPNAKSGDHRPDRHADSLASCALAFPRSAPRGKLAWALGNRGLFRSPAKQVS